MLNFLSKQLLDAANSPDNDSMMDRCEQMYSAKFHSGQPFLASGLDEDDLFCSGFTFDPVDLEAPSYSDWRSEQDYGDDYSIEKYNSWVKRNFKSKTFITPETQLVEVCNYKGEGEGFAVYESVCKLPVFRSKNDSFASFRV